jgi:ABC-type thiamin/hydroxymethylpyrimidine transport system permease subunit
MSKNVFCSEIAIECFLSVTTSKTVFLSFHNFTVLQIILQGLAKDRGKLLYGGWKLVGSAHLQEIPTISALYFRAPGRQDMPFR